MKSTQQNKQIQTQHQTWLESRKNYITASNVPCIIYNFTSNNAIKYSDNGGFYKKDKYSLLKQYTKQPTTRMLEGNAWEAAIAESVKTHINPCLQIKANGYKLWIEKETDTNAKTQNKLAATPDFFCRIKNKNFKLDEALNSENIKVDTKTAITSKDGLGLIECKNTSGSVFNWNDGLPTLSYIFQLQTQMLCTGAKWGMVVVRVEYTSGAEYFYYITRARKQAYSEIKTCTDKFLSWKGNLEDLKESENENKDDNENQEKTTTKGSKFKKKPARPQVTLQEDVELSTLLKNYTNLDEKLCEIQAKNSDIFEEIKNLDKQQGTIQKQIKTLLEINNKLKTCDYIVESTDANININTVINVTKCKDTIAQQDYKCGDIIKEGSIRIGICVNAGVGG